MGVGFHQLISSGQNRHHGLRVHVHMSHTECRQEGHLRGTEGIPFVEHLLADLDVRSSAPNVVSFVHLSCDVHVSIALVHGGFHLHHRVGTWWDGRTGGHVSRLATSEHESRVLLAVFDAHDVSASHFADDATHADVVLRHHRVSVLERGVEVRMWRFCHHIRGHPGASRRLLDRNARSRLGGGA
eukprot:scaffold2859_cov349-Pavlova_lutheri.AAC.23